MIEISGRCSFFYYHRLGYLSYSNADNLCVLPDPGCHAMCINSDVTNTLNCRSKTKNLVICEADTVFHDGLDRCHSLSTGSAQSSVFNFGMCTAVVHVFIMTI